MDQIFLRKVFGHDRALRVAPFLFFCFARVVHAATDQTL